MQNKEIELTLKLKLNLKEDHVHNTICSIKQFLYSRDFYLYDFKVLENKVNALPEFEKLRAKVFSTITTELANKYNYIASWNYSLGDNRIYLDKIFMKQKKCWGIFIIPISEDNISIKCSCYGNDLNVQCSLDNLSKNLFEVLTTHQCNFAPG